MKKVYSIAGVLFISLFIYAFYRSDKTVINELIILILSEETYISIKSFIVSIMPLPEPIIFSLPGGLWVFCVTILSSNFYLPVKQYRIPMVFLPILFATGLELCQLIHLTRGRFDLWDVVFYLLFWLLAYHSFQSRWQQQQNIFAPFTIHGFICLVCFFSVYLAHVNH